MTVLTFVISVKLNSSDVGQCSSTALTNLTRYGSSSIITRAASTVTLSIFIVWRMRKIDSTTY